MNEACDYGITSLLWYSEIANNHDISISDELSIDWEHQTQLLATIAQGWVISFPHVFDETSLKQQTQLLWQVVQALYKSGKDVVIWVWVLHYWESSMRNMEFSLCIFRYLLEQYSKANDCTPIKFIEVYQPSMEKEIDEWVYTRLIAPDGLQVSLEQARKKYPEAAIVTTADTAHFNIWYSEKSKIYYPDWSIEWIHDLQSMVAYHIQRMLEGLFEDGNERMHSAMSSPKNLGNDALNPQSILKKTIFPRGGHVDILENYAVNWLSDRISESFVMSTLFTIKPKK